MAEQNEKRLKEKSREKGSQKIMVALLYVM